MRDGGNPALDGPNACRSDLNCSVAASQKALRVQCIADGEKWTIALDIDLPPTA
jgi:hypothetical protein